ncbi:RrF2 family transcriptional regulator [Oleidesulfovibrio sp.]|uniref:RrF2 family transcriptional regulator n=1 Tax=Oleidesulfovibrio sp. TaxID=2909707 RepID=UPI003A8A72A3
MKLSARTRYATRLLLDLALHDDNTPRRASMLSESTGVTVQFIEQILKPLKKEGIVTSVRGATGGHLLAVSPKELTLGRIVRVMEGGIHMTECSRDDSACERSHDCKTRLVWMRISKVMEEELESITLAELMHDSSMLGPPHEAKRQLDNLS